MFDEELRTIVRNAIARHMRGQALDVGEPETIVRDHASHHLLPLQRGGDLDGACLIEPAVRCNHCGYCLSFGH